MECRCGMEFCYACGGVYNDCECSKKEIRGFRQPRGDDDYYDEEEEMEDINI
jgi:hypothetical protein